LGAASGEALRTLHDLALQLPYSRHTGHKVELVSDTASQLTRFLPSRPGAERLGVEVVRRLRAAETPAAGPTHHDFHGRNVLIDGSSPGLIDFEDLAMGDGADDVGSMYAHLTALAHRQPGRAGSIGAERDAFVESYGISAIDDRFVAHASMHCLLAGYQALRHPAPTSARRAEQLVDSCERILEGGRP
jgi:aminoglycoside phosphotransferase (APT) family kinase protein